MRIAVDYQDERLDFDLEGDRVVAHRAPVAHAERPDIRPLLRAAIESPRDFPPLLRAVVPGDRVVIPIDPALPDLAAILDLIAATLRTAEVDSITAIADAPSLSSLPEGVTWVVHDPDDRSQLAYLSATSDGQRIYLNRLLTDADIVIPVGALGYDPAMGYRGPWSVIYPALSERAALARCRGMASDEPPDRDWPRPALREATEVTWLLGCQLQVGVVPGASGAPTVVAGIESAVRDAGAKAVDDEWTFPVEERADLVVAGIGEPGRAATINDLAQGLATAARLVRRGGKIVALSRVVGEPGPALRRIAGAEGSGSLGRLRGHEADSDYPAAKLIASSLAWADVYLLSELDADFVDDLGIIPIDRPEEARKLARAAASCSVLSQAERTRAVVAGEE